MKYLILVTDGAADEPMEAFGGKTPLEASNLPHINELAAYGTVGMVNTIPKGMSPGSDAANLSVMGYDPKTYHTGRSPLEAVSMGIELSDTDVAFRCNLVTLTGDNSYEEKTILDHSSGDISTEEARILIAEVNRVLGTDLIQFYPGVSYRHAMIVENGHTQYQLTPPHDILEKTIKDYLPKGNGADLLTQMMKDSFSFLSKHPINRDRVKRGLNPANSIWIWGQGRKPSLPSFYDKYQVKGVAISAVDLIKGIGICAGLKTVDVPGATGTIHTNYTGKAEAAIDQFKKGKDFVYLHLEAPDECSHQGDLSGKMKSLELIDEKIMGPVAEYLKQSGEPYRLLVLPDHPTPIRIRTHTADPVPFVFYDSTNYKTPNRDQFYGESSGAKGLYFDHGYELTDFFFGRI